MCQFAPIWLRSASHRAVEMKDLAACVTVEKLLTHDMSVRHFKEHSILFLTYFRVN